ncbi:MAG: thymidylate kinase [gamma proteobacterium symbiont of Ctena orbiculata]|nr:thymidylate kinase [Candidatus Thiodiazotropha taylori]MBT3058665.1 thymidylate kinase [Candidatus Thiodiazotropha sp. (ex Lucina pensylvanica)]MBV2097248.1 thymidylate kinase [Candidatus Thiodiazotropha sp. (ex Codakia orbicularis)]PUB76658.1 MAG: thymidylate kinase [gamma proteobacterium symbiont of Ctena orbiculata]PUB79973.1 MAG: thymidylate kinase [gamma proteobacterium symbiont of Ctena orbiculata]
MDLMHLKAEFETGRLSEAVAEPAEQREGWRLLFHTLSGETLVLTDHSGRERVYHSLDHATEVGRDIGFDSVRVEEHF